MRRLDEILVLSANVLQANGRNKECPASVNPGDQTYNQVKTCRAQRREGAFAERVRDLAAKDLNEEIDGMGVIPDIILSMPTPSWRSTKVRSRTPNTQQMNK